MAVDQLDKPNVVLPLASSYNTRGILGYTAAVTNGLDQRKVNLMYEPVVNSLTGKTTLYIAKRPGVTLGASGHSMSSDVVYLLELKPGATGLDVGNIWGFGVFGNDVRAHDINGVSTTIVTAAGYAPVFVDKTKISGADTLVVQLINSSGTQTAWHSTGIGTFTQISDSTFTGLTLRGKIEHQDGFAHVGTPDKIYSSDLNSISSWGDSSFISRRTTQDVGVGLARLGSQIISFGQFSMEVYRNVGNPTGSPLQAVPAMDQPYGLSSSVDMAAALRRHYYAEQGGRIYWISSRPQGVFAYDGQRVEKVSSLNIDKILVDRSHHYVSPILVGGQQAISIGLDAANSATQRALIFFPEWKDWFEWTSSEFIPQGGQKVSSVFPPVTGSNVPRYLNSQSIAGISPVETWTDAGSNYQWLLQFRLPKQGNGIERMSMFGLAGDTARSAQTVNVQFSDDDGQNFSTARTIDMTSHKKALYGCGAYRTPRTVRLSATDALDIRLESALARVD